MSARWRKLAPLVGATIALVAALVLVILFVRIFAAPTSIVLATGGRGGKYVTVGPALVDVFGRAIPDAGFTTIQTAGSKENLERLADGKVQLAIIQNDTAGRGEEVRAIAPLYEECLHIIVPSESGVNDLLDLRGKTVSVGAARSGTEDVTRRVLDHFGILSGVTCVNSTTPESVARFEAGEVDAVAFVSGVKWPAAERLLDSGQGRLLSLGAIDRPGSALEGIRVESPFLYPTVIPARSYGSEPAQAVGTIGVRGVLVANAALDPALVEQITRALFEHRFELSERDKLLANLSERFDPADLRHALHRGAEAYYARSRPSFLVRYAEALSLLFTLLVAAASALLALRGWLRQRRKERIDVYYAELKALTVANEGSSAAERRSGLKQLQWRALDDLMAERLTADASFGIFQTLLRDELEELRRASGGEPSPPAP